MLMIFATFVISNAFFVRAANILILATVPSPSHYIWISAIISELAERGHNLTVISPDVDQNPPTGTHYILLENQYDDDHRVFVKEMLAATEEPTSFQEVLSYFDDCTFICQALVKTNGFKTLFNYPNGFKFDLIIHDYTTGPCFLPFVHKFKNPPLLAFTGYSIPSFTPLLMGGHWHFPYVPHNALIYDGNMNFFRRLHNFLLYSLEYIVRLKSMIPTFDAIAKENFGSDIPSVGDIEQQTVLAFVNTNPVMDYLSPLPENVIPVAGVHIKDPKPIPKDLEAFIGSSNKGTVIVSLGSNFRSDFLPQAKQKIFLDVFSELPEYNFVWKFESNISASDLPKNVLIQPWLPISNILADSKTKAIFSHGGLLTTQEVIWRGVPMIIMPFAYDQNQNLIKTNRLGMSEGVNYITLSKNQLKNTLLKVLKNPSYASNAAKWSTKFRDQKEHPLDRAIWWIEWLLRNSDIADNFRSPTLRLGYIAGNAYDIIAFTIFIFVVIFLILLKVIRKVCKLVLRRNDSNSRNHEKHE